MNINNVLKYLEEIRQTAKYIFEKAEFDPHSHVEQAAESIWDSVSRIEAEMRDIDG